MRLAIITAEARSSATRRIAAEVKGGANTYAEVGGDIAIGGGGDGVGGDALGSSTSASTRAAGDVAGMGGGNGNDDSDGDGGGGGECSDGGGDGVGKGGGEGCREGGGGAGSSGGDPRGGTPSPQHVKTASAPNCLTQPSKELTPPATTS